MKKVMLMIALAVSGLFVWAQDTDVPASVADAFKKKFADASGAEWYESEKGYEVQFVIGEKSGSADFSSTGSFIASKIEINATKMPSAVKATVDKKYAGLSVYDLYKNESSAGVTYEVTVETEEYNTIYLLISESGKLLKEELPAEPTGDEYGD